jgi:NAD(P)H-hydrate epimerase
MLGAAALTSLAAMRSGAGLVTAAVPQSLNSVLQKKISNVVMTWPVPETKEQAFSFAAFPKIESAISKYNALAIGPGLSLEISTQRLVRKAVFELAVPMVIDADALNALGSDVKFIAGKKGPVPVMTPHPGEMSRLTGMKVKDIESDRKGTAKKFAGEWGCAVLLKGHRTVIASPEGKVYENTTGNAGMATAGSGDVLTGMIASFLAQGLEPFDAAKYGAYFHGKAGDAAAKLRGKTSLIATDIIDNIKII